MDPVTDNEGIEAYRYIKLSQIRGIYIPVNKCLDSDTIFVILHLYTMTTYLAVKCRISAFFFPLFLNIASDFNCVVNSLYLH